MEISRDGTQTVLNFESHRSKMVPHLAVWETRAKKEEVTCPELNGQLGQSPDTSVPWVSYLYILTSSHNGFPSGCFLRDDVNFRYTLKLCGNF